MVGCWPLAVGRGEATTANGERRTANAVIAVLPHVEPALQPVRAG